MGLPRPRMSTSIDKACDTFRGVSSTSIEDDTLHGLTIHHEEAYDEVHDTFYGVISSRMYTLIDEACDTPEESHLIPLNMMLSMDEPSIMEVALNDVRDHLFQGCSL